MAPFTPHVTFAHVNPLWPCCSQFCTHESHVEHAASLLHATISLQQLIATQRSHFLLLVVAHPIGVPHVPLQTFEQHSLSFEHASPSGLQRGGGGGAPHVPCVHCFEQHSSGDLHGYRSAVHCGGEVSGSMITSFFASTAPSTDASVPSSMRPPHATTPTTRSSRSRRMLFFCHP